MAIAIGDTIPEAVLMEMTANGPAPVTTTDVFANRTIALFAVPGAFTPTCAVKHLPGFLEKATELAAKGVDEIVCTSVNDIFVMNAWGKSSNVDGKIRMLADGNGGFAKVLGLELDASGFGMGARSQRYSMLVENGVVKQLNVDVGGSYEVSSADYLLGQI